MSPTGAARPRVGVISPYWTLWEHTAGPYELRIGWSSRDIVTRLVVDES